MIDRMSGRVSLLLVSGALILVLLLGWFLLIAPQRSKASSLDSQLNDTNVQLAAVTSLLNGPVGKQSLAALKVSEIAVPDDAKWSQILRQLSTSASKAGVELDGITPQLEVPITGAQALPMQMMVKGRYFAIQSFLRDLRSAAELQGDNIRASGRLYTVDSLQFTGQAPTTGATGQPTNPTGFVQATLTVNAFLYDATAVGVAPVAPTTTTGTSTTAASTTP